MSSARLKIAVVDDSPFYGRYLSKQLERYEPYFTFESKPILETFYTTQEFLNSMDGDTNIVFLDYYLDNGVTALHVLPRLRKRAPRCEVIIISQHPDAKDAIRKKGDKSLHFVLKDREAAMRGRLLMHDLLSRHLLEQQLASK